MSILSPRASSSSTIVFASVSSPSPQPLTYKLGFFGAGATTGAGNEWFKLMADNAGVAKLYVQNDGNTALWDFLKAIDVNNNRVITAAEVSNLTLKVCGYSWGGISAIGFTQKIATAGTIVVGGSPHDPIAYQLEVGISVDHLVTIDPVEWLNPAGMVQNNVKAFQNWYQLRGGYAMFRDSPDLPPFGNSFSALLKGDAIQVQAPLNFNNSNTRVDDPNWGTRVGQPFGPYGNPTTYSLSGSEVNHDAMPWLVGEAATALMQ